MLNSYFSAQSIMSDSNKSIWINLPLLETFLSEFISVLDASVTIVQNSTELETKGQQNNEQTLNHN
jgi:hypothetical protein